MFIRTTRGRALAWITIFAFSQTICVTRSAPVFAQPAKAPASKPAVDLIAKAQQLFEDQQYEESIQTLSAALVRPTNTKEQKVEIYRLLALNYITLGRKDEADNAVRGLLVVNPDYDLPANESPRFRDFFAQAKKKWEAEGRPGLVKEQPQEKPVALRHGSPAQAEEGKAIDLTAKLEDDAGRTGSVKLYYRAGSKGDFTEALAEVEGGNVRAQIPGSAVKPPLMDYYFEVLDGAGGVIASRGDSQAPLRVAVPDSNKGSGWVLPVVGGSLLGAAAIVGILALAGVFKSSSSDGGGAATSRITITIGEATR
jgi:hypothetical protein